MSMTRRPYPYPTYDGDNEFQGRRTMPEQTLVRERSTLSGQVRNSSARLHGTFTLSSLRREATYFDPLAPNDSLDFHLKTEYNQHREFLKDKHETLLQAETLGKPHGRLLKNRSYTVPPGDPSLGHPLRTVSSPHKENRNSVKNAISGHHTQTTNVGYSRKPDGGFYTS